MKLFNILAAGTLAGMVATSALAATDAVVNQIAQELAAQGYTKIHIVNHNGKVEVEATGPNGRIEATYDNSGNVVSSSNGGADDSAGTMGGGLVDGVVDTNTPDNGNSGLGDDDNDHNGGVDNDNDSDNRSGGSSDNDRSGSGHDNDDNDGHESGEHKGHDNDD